MDELDWLAARFEENQEHLRRVAYRMLGSRNEAEDAVQEAWLKLSRSDTSGVANLQGWLTTVVARVCLDMLRSRRSRREEPLETTGSEPLESSGARGDPEQDAILADSVGRAMFVVLEALAPAEPVAFVLHDMFAVPFEEIAPIVGRSPAAARQLASRARRRVQGSETTLDSDRTRQHALVEAFLAASRAGDFGALLAVLDPDIVLRADAAAVHMGAFAEVRGAKAVADTFKGRAQAAEPALIDGAAGLVWTVGGRPRVVIQFTSAGGKIVAIDLVADPERIGRFDLTLSGG